METGERLAVPERVIVAPATGKFRPAERPDGDGIGEGFGDGIGEALESDSVIGFVDGSGQSTPVRSPFRGLLMGLLAHTGERVREGQPVAWLRTA